MEAHKTFFALFSISLLSLVSCTSNSSKENTFGDIDMAAIAADTTMQNNIETSFEYVKDHPFKGNRIFSIVNGGYTGFKDAIIYEKISMTEFDTLTVLELDSERIQTSFITDFDNNESPEIHVISRPVGKKYLINNIVVQNGNKWSVQRISMEKEMNTFNGNEKWEANENSLRLNFPDTTGTAEIRFILKNNRFSIGKTDLPKQ